MFEKFPKLGRLSKGITITEKLDGTNAQLHVIEHSLSPASHIVDQRIHVSECGRLSLFAGSRNRYVYLDKDNYGFANWAKAHADDLIEFLGEGRHYGEWWGAGVQRRYDREEKIFSLFNTNRWGPGRQELPDYLSVVPVLYQGPFDTTAIDDTMMALKESGSVAAPGFMNPEGIVVFDHATGTMFKKTYEYDKGKWTGEK